MSQQISELDAIFARARGAFAASLALESQLAVNDRYQARLLTYAAIRQLLADLSEWMADWRSAGPLIGAEEAVELEALVEGKPG